MYLGNNIQVDAEGHKFQIEQNGEFKFKILDYDRITQKYLNERVHVGAAEKKTYRFESDRFSGEIHGCFVMVNEHMDGFDLHFDYWKDNRNN
jgi:hypothetical protein